MFRTVTDRTMTDTSTARVQLPRLHVIVGDELIARSGFAQRVVEVASAGGASLALHLRARNTGTARLFACAEKLVTATDSHGGWAVINDRVDVALGVSADAVHLRHDSLPAEAVRKIAGDSIQIGKSVHSPTEVARPEDASVGYFVLGTVHRTKSHPGREPLGTDAVLLAVARSDRPVLAIGGITPARTAPLLAMGAYGVVVKSGVWADVNPPKMVTHYLEALAEYEADSAGKVLVNGDPRTVAKGTTVAELLRELALKPEEVVVEHNRQIIARKALTATLLRPGDQIEIVHFVGGG